MFTVRVLGVAAGAVIAAALFTAAPATADPGMPPCGMLAPVCNMVPTMPDLDHDIDLSKQQPPGTGVDQENLPPPDVCAIACI
jgi:hypothetical protein